MRAPPKIAGRWTPPGDKSLSHRALILAALAGGRAELERVNDGDDVANTARALRALGARVRRRGSLWIVESAGAASFSAPGAAIDCGNSGTTMRLFAGILAACPFESTLVGDASLSARPMARVARPLEAMGASIRGKRARGGRGIVAPLRLRGGRLRASRHVLDVASAQVKSAILLAGWIANVAVEVSEPQRSRDHTERMMRSLGADVRSRGRTVRFRPGATLAVPAGVIPGDPSAGAFFAAAAAALPGSDLRIDDCLVNPTRLGFYRLLARIGARVEVKHERTWCGEPAGTIRVRPGALRGFRIGAPSIPSLVDEIPMLAILAASACRGRTRIEGAQELRVKESDRISALARGLERLGARVEELPDGLLIEGGRLRGGRVEAAGDHRIAMAFRVASLLAERPVRVEGAGTARVSNPAFARDLARLVGGARV